MFLSDVRRDDFFFPALASSTIGVGLGQAWGTPELLLPPPSMLWPGVRTTGAGEGLGSLRDGSLAARSPQCPDDSSTGLLTSWTDRADGRLRPGASCVRRGSAGRGRREATLSLLDLTRGTSLGGVWASWDPLDELGEPRGRDEDRES